MLFILFLIGILGGVLAGLLGIGGGIVFIAVLPYFLQASGVQPQDIASYTIANSLFGTFFSGLASVVSQQVGRKQRDLPYAQALITAITASAFAMLCFWLIVSQPWYSKNVFSTVVVVLLSVLLARTLYSLFVKQPEPTGNPTYKPAFLATVGAFSGTVSSLSGLGGGIIVVPALRFLGKYPISFANFISSFTVALASVSAIVISYFLNASANPWGYIVPEVSAPLAFGVLAGAPIGVRLVPRLSPKTITILFCVFVGIVLAKYLYTLIAS